jgi:hypothetical protein
MAVIVAAAPLAQADSKTFHDARGDTNAPSDITKVVVRNGGPSGTRVSTSAQVGDLAPHDRVSFWFDTRRRNVGPEYRVVVEPNSDGLALEKVSGWRGPTTIQRCRGLRAHADAFGPDVVSASVPRPCIDRPPRVRVAVKAKFVYARRIVVDWAPGQHAFFGSVPK